jgi:hypothetical protein
VIKLLSLKYSIIKKPIIFNLFTSDFKYKQQITVFIVGQSEAIERKNLILAQLNDVI